MIFNFKILIKMFSNVQAVLRFVSLLDKSTAQNFVKFVMLLLMCLC